MGNIKNELEIIKQYRDDYYEDIMYDLYYLKDNGRYELFEKCYKCNKSKYNGVIRWEFLFDNLLKSFRNHNYDAILESVLSPTININNINIEKLSFIFLQQKNNYNLNTLADVDNSVHIKNDLINKIYQFYKQGIDIYELLTKYEITDKKIINSEQFLKDLIFQKVFNLSYSEAQTLINSYGKNISNVNGIDKSLIMLINNLKSVNEITDKQELDILFQNSLTSDIDLLNYNTIDRILSTSYSMVYSQANYQPKPNDRIGRISDKIPIYEIGTEFYMNVHVVGGVFANDTTSYKTDWESRDDLFVSTSFIGNTNMNTCPIGNVCYGFCSFSANDILDAGPKNIFMSNINYFNPQSIYRDGNINHVQYAMPQEFLQESKREKWNEIGYRRFTEDGKRIYPDYIVYFSDGQINTNDKIWLNSVKAATEFSIPIVVVNKKKINEYNAIVPETNEFVPQKAVVFDSEKLTFTMEQFNNIIKSQKNDVPNNTNILNERRDNTMWYQQNLNTIKTVLGVTFTDSYYSMGGQDVNSPPSITFKTLKELQEEYTKLDLKLREKLDDNEITAEQCIVVSKALNKLYNEYKNNAVTREKQSQQSKIVQPNSSNNSDEYNPDKNNSEQVDSFENIRVEARRKSNYDNMSDAQKKDFNRKLEETIRLRKQRSAYKESYGYNDMTDEDKEDFDKRLDEIEKAELAVRNRLINQGIDPDQLSNYGDLVEQERKKIRFDAIEETEQVERSSYIR